jgi:hypothetical protein
VGWKTTIPTAGVIRDAQSISAIEVKVNRFSVSAAGQLGFISAVKDRQACREAVTSAAGLGMNPKMITLNVGASAAD